MELNKYNKSCKYYKKLHSKLYVIIGSSDSDCFVGLKNSLHSCTISSTVSFVRDFCNYEVSFDCLLTIYEALLVKDVRLDMQERMDNFSDLSLVFKV